MIVNLSIFEFSSKKSSKEEMSSYSPDAYQAKLESIFTRYPSVQKVPFGDAYKPGLDHMARFEALLGNPHKDYRTIHVAGTNGKGSVASMLSSVLSSAGLKVGLYTSPHIEDFRERARILQPQGTEPFLVPEDFVYDFLCSHEQDFESLDLSFFEITTGLAFKWFSTEKVDVAVIEVGLGGRLDSTNIIVPDLSIVTSIALDHCALLGDTLQAIAGEKSGIFKEGVPALVGEYLPETMPVFQKKAEEVHCPLTFAQDAIPVLPRRAEDILSRMDLKGKYQEKNLRTVLCAVDILTKDPFYNGLHDKKSVEEAIINTAFRSGFHGRWEKLSDNPEAIADIGHNPAALKGNFAQLEEMMATGKYTSLVIVYAVMADKDLEGIMPLMPEKATYILTSPQTRRALPEEELTRMFKDYCEKNGKKPEGIIGIPTVREAVEKAMTFDSGGNPLIYFGGSTYLVSEVVRILQSTKA